VELQNDKKAREDVAAEKLVKLLQKVKSIGNYVHDSVPVSNNEVRMRSWVYEQGALIVWLMSTGR
jgi:hypothetical protein